MTILRSIEGKTAQELLGKFTLWENYISISLQIEWDMIVKFLSILNLVEFYLVQNRKENCHHDQLELLEKFTLWENYGGLRLSAK